MATMDDLDEFALAMPQVVKTSDDDERVDYAVNGKTFARHREPRRDAIDAETGERMEDVLMFKTENIDARDSLLLNPHGAFFITEHFAGYPAVLVRIPHLGRLSREELDDLVVEAWLACAPKRLAKAWLAEQQT